ncbi:MAG: DsbA family protein [Planctomycetota bacterium]|nr:DsbA family protein [Planctomycetota bacterium]MDA1141896.1 DsbA family protein [Planctomycetota bacterium]
MRNLIYVGDIMCSWCWGFAPTLCAILDEFGHQLRLEIVHGGLRPGPKSKLLDDEMRDFLKQHWTNVTAQSGQPFNNEFFGRKDFLYDTGPAARAALTIREMDAALEYPFCHGLQEAFYARNVDITDLTGIQTVVRQVGADADDFQSGFESEWSHQAMTAEFEKRRGLGVRSFPTLLLRDAGAVSTISVGYQNLETIRAALFHHL